MDDLLNPVSPRNPNQIGGEGSKEETTNESYIEGAEYVPLPSRGVFYTWNAYFAELDRLRIRQLNYSDEDILTTRSFLEDGSVFLELLKNVICDDSHFPASGLVPVDRDTILFWLRSTSFGNDFEAETACPACGHRHTIHWDISSFKIPEFPEEIYKELKENHGEYTIITPLKGLQVKITIPSIGKAKEFEKALAAKKAAKKTKADLFGTGSIMLVVTAVIDEDGREIRNKNEIENYFNKIKLPLVDARFIRKSIETINLKYDTAQNIVCPACEHVQEGVELPINSPNFFWPDA